MATSIDTSAASRLAFEARPLARGNGVPCRDVSGGGAMTAPARPA